MSAPDPALDAYLSGTISAPVALMRLLFSGGSAEAVFAALEGAAADHRVHALLALARQHRDGLETLERMLGADAVHGAAADPDAAIEASRTMFDHLVRISPEASVAAYSLGDPALLRAATTELLDWLQRHGLLDGKPDILDFGCGIGRLAEVLLPHAATVTGLDVSPAMVEAARLRCGSCGNLRFVLGSGRDLAGIEDGSRDLVLAADVFPYLVQGGLGLAARHVAEAARVLRPGGSLLILNFSYRDDDAADRRDVAALAEASGFALLRNGTRELPLWDGATHWLRLA